MSLLEERTVLPRLLAGVCTDEALTLEEHTGVHGPLPPFSRGRRDGAELIDEVGRSGLTGRGGGSFPLAAKMRAVAASRGRPVVVVNGTEGEPTSRKDRLMLSGAPHLVLDGALLAAHAVGAAEIVVAVDDLASRARRAVQEALAGRHDLARGRLRARVVAVPAGYVSGQESALVSFLNGGPAKPTVTPPMVFERGVSGRPTLVSNVETLAHLALIARHGAAWFRSLGTPEAPGSTLVTLGGAVAEPGVYELENGAPLSSLVEAAGGLTRPARALLVGGYAGAWLPGNLLGELALSNEDLAPLGASLGPGLVFVLPESACGVAETANVAAWLAGESAGQCGPCFNGLGAIAAAVTHLSWGTARPGTWERVLRWCSLVARRGACAHPDGAVRFITSALAVFEQELLDHARDGECAACAQPRLLPVPDPSRRTLAA